jgi:hypothetical protein
MSVIESIEQGRKEDGNRSIADKIIKRLHDLDKTVENNHGRWAWELLQNAKDSISDDEGRTVSIQIELDEDCVTFRHNGTHFTEQDIRGLINQISSKEVEEGIKTKKTGKFGTGFLTTHLLSRVVQVMGIVETVSGELYKFSFPLDRRGKITQQLVPRIESAWTEFHSSAKKIESYNHQKYNTSFSYHLDTNEQKRIAKIGVTEFFKLVPFVLTFNSKISRIEVVDNTTETTTVFERDHEADEKSIVAISRIADNEQEDILVLYSSNESLAIATEIEQNDRGYAIKSIRNVPKLFCDFPLIGTENFNFPVIVNSFFFNPQTERDGIWLKGSDDPEVEENQELLESAVELYTDLIAKVSEGSFFNLYNIVDTRLPITSEKYFDDRWYKENIQKPIKELLLDSKLVELEAETEGKKSIKELWFPSKSYTEEIQEKIWQFTYDQFPQAVCRRKHLHKWCDLSWEGWNKLDYSELVSDLVKKKNIEQLSEDLGKNEIDAFNWLNALCTFILEDDSNLALFENNAIIPNRNGVFKLKPDLRIDRIKDDDLINILELLGEDWKDILIHGKISFGKYVIKEKKEIAAKITEKLKNPSFKNDDYVKAISLLSEWFENNQEHGKELFSELYKKRAELFMNTIKDKDSLYKVMRSNVELSKLAEVAQTIQDNPDIIDNFGKVEEFTSLLKEFNVTNVTDLKKMLRLAQIASLSSDKIEINQEVLISLGVTSLEELEEALKDKDIAAHFTHTSTPNVEMFIYVQKLIKRCKTNIIEHLKTLDEYDCDDLEELATTVIGGIKKQGLEIHLVVRPSDNNEVIVYYSSEKDTLDYANAELWIDNGKDQPRQLTLGKILKTTGINRIPV